MISNYRKDLILLRYCQDDNWKYIIDIKDNELLVDQGYFWNMAETGMLKEMYYSKSDWLKLIGITHDNRILITAKSVFDMTDEEYADYEKRLSKIKF
jgi:hypothetical protein